MRASYIIETYYYIDRAGGLSVFAPVLHPILRIFNARTEKRLHSVTAADPYVSEWFPK